MYINYEVAQIFKRLIGKFDDEFKHAMVSQQYMYATNGRTLLVCRLTDEEWYSTPPDMPEVAFITSFDFSDMKRDGAYARVGLTIFRNIPKDYTWWSVDQIWRVAGGKDKLLAAATAAKPATGFHFEWKTLATLGEPLEWACLEYPIWEDMLPAMLLVSRKHRRMFAVVAPFREGDESGADSIITRTITGE